MFNDNKHDYNNVFYDGESKVNEVESCVHVGILLQIDLIRLESCYMEKHTSQM